MGFAKGTHLGPYEILARIGAGGMGEVFRARDTRLDRHVAIKCIAPWRLGAPSALAGFLREARSASALNHPGIVTIFEVIRSPETVSNFTQFYKCPILYQFLRLSGKHMGHQRQSKCITHICDWDRPRKRFSHA